MSRAFLSGLIGALCLFAPIHAKAEADVLSLGGTVTEIIHALGQEHRIKARDTTSTYPPSVIDLPNVGYLRALSPEGVLSVGAALILSEDDAGPPETLDVIRAADVEFVTVPAGFTSDAIAQKIRIIGAALDVPDMANTLATRVKSEIDAAATNVKQAGQDPKRVLFILSARGGKLTVGGAGSSADAIIALAGGINAAQDIKGYRILTDEAAAAAAPDVVLMMARQGNHSMTADELFSLPALAITPAAKTKALITMNGLKLLGFGPRTGQAVTDLHTALYGG